MSQRLSALARSPGVFRRRGNRIDPLDRGLAAQAQPGQTIARWRTASAATVVLPTESVVFISISSRRISRDKARTGSAGEAAQAGVDSSAAIRNRAGDMAIGSYDSILYCNVATLVTRHKSRPTRITQT